MDPDVADFLRQPGRAGVFGALIDETARAAHDFCRVVEAFDLARFEGRRASDDPNCVSPRAIATHVVQAAHRYSHYVRKARGFAFVERFELDPGRLVRPADARALLRDALHDTERAVEGLRGDEDEMRQLAFTVRWGPRYDPEMILEHGVCHLLRHRRQLERW
jgi:hypothetical protein